MPLSSENTWRRCKVTEDAAGDVAHSMEGSHKVVSVDGAVQHPYWGAGATCNYKGQCYRNQYQWE